MKHDGLTYLVAAGAAAALAIAAASCTDALRLEPPPGQPSSTSTSGTAGSGGTTGDGGGGTGGSTTSGCKSNADCADPTPICDTAYGNCVQCLVQNDCFAVPGTVCSLGSCSCPGGGTYCGPNNCVDTGTDPDNCGFCGRFCYGACAAGSCTDAWEPIKELSSCGSDQDCQETIPIGRRRHVSVWTGDRMIVWGGETAGGFTQTGGLYDHAAYEWQPTSLVNAPSARRFATAVWTGTEMIVWGGDDGPGYTNTGGRYNPATNTWQAVSTLGAPEGRIYHTAVWTGDRMIVWGGDGASNQLNTGGVYDPATDTWTATGINTSGVTRRMHSAIWNSNLGAMMIYGGWGDPPGFADVYLPYTNAPGGEQFILVNNGWLNLNTISEPPSRAQHTAVFNGSDMIVWGGYNGASYLDTGYRYTQGAWLALAGAAPEGRQLHTAVWIQGVGRMIVWGGEGASSTFLDTGGEFDSATNAWITATPTAPPGRRFHTAVAAGDQMMIWGGQGASNNYLAGGGVYTPQ